MKNWNVIPFEKSIQKVTYTNKIPKKQFLENGTYPIVSQESDPINGYWNCYEDVFTVDTPLIIFGDHTKVIKYIDFDFVLGADGVKILKPIKDLNARFFAFFLENVSIANLGYARHYRLLKEIMVPIPPIHEQKRIVNILDQAFADIEQARAKTEQNLKNARELFESACTNSIFSSDASPNHIVSDVAKDEKGSMRTGPFGSQLLKKEIVDEGIAVLGIDNAVNNHFQWGAKRFITQEKFEELSRFEVKPDDVLITIMGTCGRCAIVPKNIPKAINTKHICCITLEQSKCLPEYLHAYFLYHPIAKEYLLSRAKGAIMAGLNMGIIKELPLILPTLEEQKNLVSRVTKLKGHIDALEVTYRSKLNALEALKKSILQKAFAGELSKSIA
jgi:restriction endonuclease S subunit